MYGVKYMSKKHEKNVPSAKLFCDLDHGVDPFFEQFNIAN